MSRRHATPLTHAPRGYGRIFGVPLLIGVVTAVGLVSALVGDGAYDAVSWVALGMPAAAGLWLGWGRR